MHDVSLTLLSPSPLSFLSLLSSLPPLSLPLSSSLQVEECLVCSEVAASTLFKPCLHMVACESELTQCSIASFLGPKVCVTMLPYTYVLFPQLVLL